LTRSTYGVFKEYFWDAEIRLDKDHPQVLYVSSKTKMIRFANLQKDHVLDEFVSQHSVLVIW